jgi:hypothetical protein
MIDLDADVSFTTTHYGGVLLDERAARYWQLNGAGALALQTLLDGGGTCAAAAAVCEQYDTTADTALADVAALVADLQKAGLIHEARSQTS